jgi:hypothetical protein
MVSIVLITKTLKMKPFSILFLTLIFVFLNFGCKNESDNEDKIFIMKKVLSKEFQKNRWIFEKIKSVENDSPNPQQYELLNDTLKNIFKEREKAFVMNNDDLNISSEDAVKRYENFLGNFVKKSSLEIQLDQKIKTVNFKDSTDLNFWINSLQIAHNEYVILANYADKVGIYTNYCGFSKFNLVPDDTIILEKPYYVSLSFYEQNKEYNPYAGCQVDRVQILLNNKTVINDFEVRQHRATTILRFIPHQKGKYFISVTMKEKTSLPAPNNWHETRSLEVQLK